jgi:uncharacterized protein (TIGR02594 family)
MPSISRDQFIASFQGGSLDLANLSPELRQDLAAAGITADKLRQIAGGDGIIRGGDELAKLFKEIDNLDHDGSYRTLTTADAKGHESQAGALIGDLQAEVERNRLRTPVGPGPRTPEGPKTAAPAAPPPKTPSSATPWLDVASKEIGQKEDKAPGANNPRIVEYHASTKGKFSKDETPWCSSFVNWVMEQSKKPGTDSARALSWKTYGTKSDGPVVGSIAVLDYGNGKGHVGFVVGRDGDNIVVLGGNQHDSVSYRTFPAKAIAEYRLPPGFEPAAGPLPEIKLKNNKPVGFSETR